MYKILGIISLALVIVITAPYWLRKLNGWTLKTRDKRFLSLLKTLRKLHKPLGLVLVIISGWHGYDILRLRPHSGLITFISFIVTGILGGVYYKTKNKKVFKVHKAMALISVLLMVLHLLWPNALRDIQRLFL